MSPSYTGWVEGYEGRGGGWGRKRWWVGEGEVEGGGKEWDSKRDSGREGKKEEGRERGKEERKKKEVLKPCINVSSTIREECVL